MDEGVQPSDPFPDGHHAQVEDVKAEEPIADDVKVAAPIAVEPSVVVDDSVESIPPVSKKFEKPVFKAPVPERPDMGAFLSQTDTSGRFGSWKLMAVVAAVALIVGVIAVPWGWYARSKAAKLANEVQTVPAQNTQPAPEPVTANETPAAPAASVSVVPETSSEAADLAAKRAREARLKERAARAQEPVTAPAPIQSTPAVANASVAKTQSSQPAGAKKATVQVTYDENGRVTQASGGDATALRIARQKRFPAGKAGSATITIPIN
jgi:hypothetical protein